MNATHTIKATELQTTTQRLLVSAGTPQMYWLVPISQAMTLMESCGFRTIWIVLQMAQFNLLRNHIFCKKLTQRSRSMDKTALVTITALKGMERAIQKAKESNMCGVSFTNIGHIARLGHYAEQTARGERIGLITYGTGRSDRGRHCAFRRQRGTIRNKSDGGRYSHRQRESICS